jgi:glyoxylase-like metal-dependent hydrolase (beta-lactamase superfamily II)
MSPDFPLGRRQFLAGTAAVGVGAILPTALGLAAPASAAPARGTMARSPIRHAAAVRSVGGFDVVALLDADGPFFVPPEVAFPDATPEDWNRARRVDPDAFAADGAWHLDFRCFAVRRRGGRVTLVDTGIGPEGSPASAWAPVPGHLPEALDAAGIAVSDVDTVVLTHAHEDHYGWSVSLDGVPVFPNAHYVVQRTEVDALVAGGDTTALSYLVEPLRRTGQLRQVDGRTLLATGEPGTMTVIPTPGHTPGHQSVIVRDGSTEIVLTGDVLVHAVQLLAPEVGYLFESDQEVARQTRQALLDRTRRHHAVLATAHLNRPFVALG